VPIAVLTEHLHRTLWKPPHPAPEVIIHGGFVDVIQVFQTDPSGLLKIVGLSRLAAPAGMRRPAAVSRRAH
jgi:hypothetical protein